MGLRASLGAKLWRPRRFPANMQPCLGVRVAMNENPGSAADNLTGVWNGVFHQPDCGSVAFTATLIESGGQITGSTHEPCALPGCQRRTWRCSRDTGRAVPSPSSKPTIRPGLDTAR